MFRDPLVQVSHARGTYSAVGRPPLFSLDLYSHGCLISGMFVLELFRSDLISSILGEGDAEGPVINCRLHFRQSKSTIAETGAAPCSLAV